MITSNPDILEMAIDDIIADYENRIRQLQEQLPILMPITYAKAKGAIQALQMSVQHFYQIKNIHIQYTKDKS